METGTFIGLIVRPYILDIVHIHKYCQEEELEDDLSFTENPKMSLLTRRDGNRKLSYIVF